MSAAELMTEIRSLSSYEKQELCDWLQKDLESVVPDTTQSVDFKEAMNRVFQKHDALLQTLSQ